MVAHSTNLIGKESFVSDFENEVGPYGVKDEKHREQAVEDVVGREHDSDLRSLHRGTETKSSGYLVIGGECHIPYPAARRDATCHGGPTLPALPALLVEGHLLRNSIIRLTAARLEDADCYPKLEAVDRPKHTTWYMASTLQENHQT